jgi:hypothetical protein
MFKNQFPRILVSGDFLSHSINETRDCDLYLGYLSHALAASDLDVEVSA